MLSIIGHKGHAKEDKTSITVHTLKTKVNNTWALVHIQGVGHSHRGLVLTLSFGKLLERVTHATVSFYYISDSEDYREQAMDAVELCNTLCWCSCR